jgi:zinc transport system substrate-binding protein
MHIWLSPHNAVAMAAAIAARLGDIDPGNAERYRANLAALETRLEALETELEERLEPVRGRGYVVFHDAYQYFEREFALQPLGSITVSPDLQPGTRQLAELRQAIVERDAVCVFAEPQFEPRLVEMLVEGTTARSAVLDPLGAALEPGPEAYPTLLANLATALRDCLTPQS